MPEFVVQEGVKRAWEFLQKNSRVLGYLCKNIPTDRQKGYRRQIEEEFPAIVWKNPSVKIHPPAFILSLLGENEIRQYIGDDAPSHRDMPHPSPGVEVGDYPEKEKYHGVVYGEDEGPMLLGVDGDKSGEPSRRPLDRKNLVVQHAYGDEQYEHMGTPQRLWDEDQQRLTSRAVVDQMQIGIQVMTGNAENTFVYYRLLKWVLRRFYLWFQVNGLHNLTFSGMDLMPEESLAPTGGGPPLWSRQMTLSFEYEEQSIEVETLVAGWMLEVEMATRRQDGSLDVVPIYKTSGKGDLLR